MGDVMKDYKAQEAEFNEYDEQMSDNDLEITFSDDYPDLELEARLRTNPGEPARTQEEIDKITKDYYARKEAIDRLYGEIGL